MHETQDNGKVRAKWITLVVLDVSSGWNKVALNDYIHIYIHTCIHEYMHIHIQTYTHTYIYTHIQTFTCTYTRLIASANCVAQTGLVLHAIQMFLPTNQVLNTHIIGWTLPGFEKIK